MDSSYDSDRPDVLDSETGSGRVGDRTDGSTDPTDEGTGRRRGRTDPADEWTDRDLRDVLARLVVVDGDREDLSLEEVAAAAGRSERLLPELLAAVEADATAVRIGAAWTLCAVADDRPAAASYLAERVAERMDGGARSGAIDGDEPFEIGQVLAYLRGRYPGRVADALDLAAAQDSLGEPPAESPDGRRGGPAESAARRDTATAARADANQGKRVETDGGVPAGTVADIGDGRQVVRTDGGSGAVRERPARTAEPPQPDSGPAEPRASGRPPEPRRPDGSGTDGATPANHPTDPGFDSGDREKAGPLTGDEGPTAPPSAETAVDSDAATPSEPAGPPVPEDEAWPETPETFASIAALSSFDRLSAVDRGVESRYARGYRCRAVTDEDERGVAARLFDRPDEGDRLDFRADLTDCLARWEALGDGDRVVDVVEWGERPRPWVATQPVDASLADRGRPPLDEALDQAVALAEAFAHCHRHGAVHGGLDPRNVVYPGDGLVGLDEPMLDNPGIMAVFRSYFEPADYLDPRFAAPEYYDDEFGTVDAATDVYGLGAVCHYLLTGRPPFDGSYSDVRRGVLSERPPAPSAVRDRAPDDVDPVIGKALAKRKIARYDSVEALAADLRRVRDRDG